MRLKVFRLREGKLELVGMREPMPGDSLLDNSTPMSEVIGLRESSNLVPPTAKELARARQSLGRDKLANAYKAGHPGATANEIATFVQGRSPDPTEQTPPP